MTKTTPSRLEQAKSLLIKERSDLDSDTEMVILPDPVGHHMLVVLPPLETRSAGGVYIPEMVQDRERLSAIVGVVVAMGTECYMDKGRFPSGEAWCKEGDRVMFSRYAGMRFKSTSGDVGDDSAEYRILNDDEIIATVPENTNVKAA